MKKIIKTILKTLYHIFLILLITCVCFIVYNKIRNPEERLTLFGYKIFIDATNSMSPSLNANDIIITRKCSESDIQVGKIITFKEGNVTITHRVINIISKDGKKYFITKGDNNSDKDDRLVTFEEVEGIYLFKIPFLGFIITDIVSFVLVIIVLLILAFFPFEKLNIKILDTTIKKEESIITKEDEPEEKEMNLEEEDSKITTVENNILDEEDEEYEKTQNFIPFNENDMIDNFTSLNTNKTYKN